MYLLPSLAKGVQRLGQLVLDHGYVAPGESVVLPKLDRTIPTVQIEQGLTSSPDHVNMGRAVIVEIDDHAEARKSEDCGQDLSYHIPKRLGY